MIRSLLLIFGDIFILVASFAATLSLGFLDSLTPELVALHVIPFALLYAGWILVIYLFNFYDIASFKPSFSQGQRTSGLFLSLLVVGGLFFYFVPLFGISPKTNLLINVLVFGFLWVLWRQLLYIVFAQWFKQNTLIIGSDTLTHSLQKEISSTPQLGINIIGTYATIADAKDALFNKPPSLLILQSVEDFPVDILRLVFKKGIRVLSLSDAYEKFTFRIPVSSVNEAWFLDKVSSSKNALYSLLSRFTSFVVAFCVLVVTSPILFIAALLIRLETRGPILYRQARVGRQNSIFYLYKFRSMQAISKDGSAESGSAQWAQKDDFRITKVGHILRKLHIDEVPQLINVLKGDISLVGPRPERPEFVEQLEKEIPHYHLRHIIHPGFTGWAQIKFRYARTVMESEQKFEYDLYYIKNRNFFMDIGIILRTIQIIFTH